MLADNASERSDQYMYFLLQKAELNIIAFDIHRRTELNHSGRVLPYYVMSYHKSGTAKLKVDERIHLVEPGTVILIPPNVKHDHYKVAADETVFLWWHFTFEIAGVFDVLRLFQFPVTFKLQDSESFERAFHQFAEPASNSQHLSISIWKKAKALELLFLLLESALQSPDFYYQSNHQKTPFLALLTRIIKHPEGELSLKDLSDELHMHPTYVSNQFKGLFGKAPMQLQREMRIRMAQRFLENTDKAIGEIATDVGFGGVQALNRLFKKHVGLTPSQFRNVNSKSM